MRIRSVLDQGFGWVSDDGHTRWHIAGDDRTYADNCTGTYYQGLAGLPLTKNGVRPDIGMVFDMDISITHNARGEGHEITDHTFMGDVGVDVTMKLARLALEVIVAKPHKTSPSATEEKSSTMQFGACTAMN